MKDVITDFESRVKEIDVYITFLTSIIQDSPLLYYPKKKTHKFKPIDGELIKILKANIFLLLYNLAESSIKKSLQEIYDSLNKETAQYKDVTQEFKKKWIEINYGNFKAQKYATKTLFECIRNLESDIINLNFNSKKIISGNIDGKKIRDFSVDYGFSVRTHHTTKNGEKLFQVKNNRNDLAHGLKSFCDCGKEYSINEIIEIKKQVISYLRNIIKNVNSFIINKDFLLKAV